MTATHELTERLRSIGRDWRQTEEEGEGDVDDSGDNKHINGRKAMFPQHPVRVGGLLVQRGQCEQTMTTTKRDGPPDDDEKGGNVGKSWAHATVF